jgi:hypothetical protein
MKSLPVVVVIAIWFDASVNPIYEIRNGAKPLIFAVDTQFNPEITSERMFDYR